MDEEVNRDKTGEADGMNRYNLQNMTVYRHSVSCH